MARTSRIRAVFTWMSKVSFALLRLVIGLKISRHFLSQSEVKPKPIVTRSSTFSCASCQLHVFASSFDWFTELSVSFVIDRSKRNEEAFSSWILGKKIFRVPPTGVEPMTFQVPVGRSNHWAMGDSWWARSFTRFLWVTHVLLTARLNMSKWMWINVKYQEGKNGKKPFFREFNLRTLLHFFNSLYPSCHFTLHLAGVITLVLVLRHT